MKVETHVEVGDIVRPYGICSRLAVVEVREDSVRGLFLEGTCKGRYGTIYNGQCTVAGLDEG